MQIRGRGKPLLSQQEVYPEGKALILRVDDERDPAFWLEITLARADLAAMLAALDAPEVFDTPETPEE